jgi:NitT/TauT family transport system substrate-binding protein
MKRSPFLAGVAATSLAGAYARKTAGAQELATVRVGVLGIATDAPIAIADQKGYFRDHGIKIEYIRFTSSEGMLPLLAGTGLDMGQGSPGSSLYNAVIHGIEVRAVADSATDPPGYGWAKLLIRSDLVKSGKYKSVKDLRGMTIAGAARASASSAQVARLLAQAGLEFSDVKRVVLAYPEHVVALSNGAIDAAITIEPFATLAVDNGSAVAITGNDTFYPNQETSCMLCSTTLIKERRDVIVRYLCGFLLGVRYYRTALKDGHFAGPVGAEVVKIISANTGQPEALVRRTTPTFIDPNGRMNLASMRADLAFYKAQGFIEGNVTVEQVVDTTLAPEAIKIIGLAR